MHGFPQQLDPQCVNGLIAPLFGRGSFNSAEFAACAYEALGYALYQVYGEVPQSIMSNENPADVANLLSQAPPEVQQFMDFTNAQGDRLANQESIPPWMIPFLQQLGAWALKKLLDRFQNRVNSGESVQVLGRTMRASNKLPPETGGAFPERVLGQPTGAGLFTRTNPHVQESQIAGAQSQPSDKLQQPTGRAPEAHPSGPQGSKSPQLQANTADPTVDHEPRPVTNDSLKGPGLTNAPGVQGNPVVPKESGGESGKPAQGPQTNLPPANPPATQNQQPPAGK